MRYTYNLNNTENLNESQLISLLKKQTTLVRESMQQGENVYYDTFDWRLYRQNYLLHFHDRKFYLYNYISGTVELEADYSLKAGPVIKRIKGQLSDKLYPLIGLRALIRLATIREKNQSFKILNRDKKIIGKLYFNQHQIKDGNRFRSFPPTITIIPLRGFGKEINALTSKLSLRRQTGTGENILKNGLRLVNRYPNAYSSKLVIGLSPRENTITSLRKILLHLLDTLRKNEQGIIDNIDIEFLHDFRVAVRRTRSVLSQIGGIFDESLLQKTAVDFKFLGKKTNLLRDLDVYLLREEHYKEMLPVPLRIHLHSFFAELKIQRNNEHRELVKILKSRQYKQIVENWQNFLLNIDTQNATVSEAGSVPVVDCAKNVIWRRNRKVVEFGKNILLTPSDELMHKLRIECKKLRYLLEFFTSLFPENNIQFLIKKLKQLQDNLGEFNDLTVQQNTLKRAVECMAFRSRQAKETILAIGILIGKLNSRQETVKSDFAQIFIGFSSRSVQKIFRELFYQPRRRR